MRTKSSLHKIGSLTISEGWKEIKPRRKKTKRKKGTICNGPISENANFSGVPQRKWIYLGRIVGKELRKIQ